MVVAISIGDFEFDLTGDVVIIHVGWKDYGLMVAFLDGHGFAMRGGVEGDIDADSARDVGG